MFRRFISFLLSHLDIVSFFRVDRRIFHKHNKPDHDQNRAFYGKCIFAFWTTVCVLFFTPLAHSEPRHGIAMHGMPQLAADFAHFPYANPDAPKGGDLKLANLGSFDSLNPLIIKGVSGAGIRQYVFESLMARSYSEPFSLYGLIAETIDTPEDRSWVSFKIRANAKFSDGTPLTADDVIFSHALLRDKGRPNHRFYYSKVAKVEKITSHEVKFTFKNAEDREMPLILGLMPILPKHIYKPETFEKTTLTPPIGSGPYRITQVKAGQSVLYERNPDYWGRDLAVNRGRFNFDRVQFEYFRDANTMFEAFKKGLFHVRSESDPSQWSLNYGFPAVKQNKVALSEVKLGIPAGMSALVFNTRRAPFGNLQVRQALTLMFDFTWVNKNLFHGLYRRTESFFARSELSSARKPADAEEKRLLSPFAARIPVKFLDGSFKLPVTDGRGRNRKNRRAAIALLKQAGYELKDGMMVHKQTGKPLKFEILTATRSQERLLLNFAQSLKRIGVDARLRQVDSAQYQRRKTSFDFDMIQNFWSASLSPGNEQNFRWRSGSARQEGSYNFPGIQSKAVDSLIEALLIAKERPKFISAVRALDRALMAGYYVVPLFHLPGQWVAYWTHLEHPKQHSLYGYQLDSWWHKTAQ